MFRRCTVTATGSYNAIYLAPYFRIWHLECTVRMTVKWVLFDTDSLNVCYKYENKRQKIDKISFFGNNENRNGNNDSFKIITKTPNRNRNKHFDPNDASRIWKKTLGGSTVWSQKIELWMNLRSELCWAGRCTRTDFSFRGRGVCEPCSKWPKSAFKGNQSRRLTEAKAKRLSNSGGLEVAYCCLRTSNPWAPARPFTHSIRGTDHFCFTAFVSSQWWVRTWPAEHGRL